MNRLYSGSRIWVVIVVGFTFLYSSSLFAQDRVRWNSVGLSKSLYKEDGSQTGVAEPGETLVYKLSIRNRSRQPKTVTVREVVPRGTRHIGGDDFDGMCGDGSPGQVCTLRVTIPGRRAGNHVLFFAVKVDERVNVEAIVNAAHASGVVCRSRRNDCFERIPVTDNGTIDAPPGDNSILLRKSLYSESGKIRGVAEPGETLVYRLRLRNRTRQPHTIRILETVPAGTTHAGGDDFTGLCGDGSAGQHCELRTTIKGRRHRGLVLFFKVKVDEAVNVEAIVNKVKADGVNCERRRNDCYERTRVENEPGDAPPAIEIAAPKNGDEVPAEGFVVSGFAKDDNEVGSVMVNDGSVNHAAAYSPEDGSWKADIPGPLKAGSEIKLVAVATDNSGQSTRSEPVVVKVAADAPPAVRIASPTDGDQVSENGFPVTGIAEDDNQIASIVVNDGTTNHAATYSTTDGSWKADIPGPLNAGTVLNLVAVATDNAGQSTRSNVVRVTVIGDTAPAIQINSPVDGGQVPETGFSVSGVASDNSAVVSVTVNDGSGNISANYNPASGAWSASINGPLTPGDVINLNATATDDAGNTTTTATIAVTVTAVVSGAYESSRHLINRITFGITPPQLDTIKQDTFDANTFAQEQLFPAIGDCTEPDEAHGASVDPNSPYGKNLPNGVTGLGELQTYTILMAAFNPCQLREVLAQFWSNHFLTQWNAVRTKYRESSGVDDATAQAQATQWELQESDAFRLGALGNFRDLVEISARSPAMLYYLDGVNNIAGNPNENYSRELMELNTMGVDGGYTQTDVEQVAVALTGWTVDTATGQYICDPATHDYNSTITLDLGLASPPAPLPPRDSNDLSQQNCEAAGQYVITSLVNHPSTADFICNKLVTLLVSEDANSAGYANVVNACASAFTAQLGSTTQVADVVQAIVNTPEFVNFDNYLDKIKTPLETAVGYVRNFEISEDGDLDDLPSETSQMSMNLFQYPAPDGFSEVGPDWVNSSLILQRFRFFADMVFNGSPTNDIYIDPLAFFNGKSLTTDVEIVDYVLELALSNQFTAQERAEALAVLNNGGSFNLDDAITQEAKLRNMLGLVLNYPGYQYQ